MTKRITEEEFNHAAHAFIKRKEALKSNLAAVAEWGAPAGRKADSSELEVINSYLQQRAQVATSMGDRKTLDACTMLIQEVTQVNKDWSNGVDQNTLIHEMSMLELDLRHFSAVTNQGKTRIW